MSQPAIHGGSNLFDREPAQRVRWLHVVPALTQPTAEKITQSGHVPVTMDATPASDFKVVHTEFVLGGAEALFNRPSAEGNSQQASQRHSVFSDHLIGKKVLDFAGADVAADDQRVAVGRQLARLLFSPEHGVLDFPDFRPAIGILDPVALPLLLSKDGRILDEIIDTVTDIRLANARCLGGTAVEFCFWRLAQDLGFSHPAVKIPRYFRDKSLVERFHGIQKSGVASVQFVKSPGFDADAVTQGMLDQSDGDLWLGLKFNLLGNVVFFRRTGSLAQSSGKYIRLSSRH